MKFRSLFAPCALALLAVAAPAADFGPVVTTTDGCSYVRGADGKYYPSTGPVPVAVPKVMPATAGDGLDEVNATRASRGLRPFVLDAGLAQAARDCAAYRALRRMEGHTGNDFAFVPAGSRASATGCAAWPQHLGWGSCCTYEGWTHAGAAWAMGADGRRYMSLFVSNGAPAGSPSGLNPVGASPPAYLPASLPVAQPACIGGNCGAPQGRYTLFPRR